jgi:hypothetical protein
MLSTSSYFKVNLLLCSTVVEVLRKNQCVCTDSKPLAHYFMCFHYSLSHLLRVSRFRTTTRKSYNKQVFSLYSATHIYSLNANILRIGAYSMGAVNMLEDL